MSKTILRGILPAFVVVALLGFVAGCSSTQGGYGTTRGDDTTSVGTGSGNTGTGGTDTRTGDTRTGGDNTGMSGTTGSGTTGSSSTGSSTTTGTSTDTLTHTSTDTQTQSGHSGSMMGSMMKGDAMALSMLKASDKAEVEIVQFATDRIKDSRVKDYANMLLKDHKNSLEKTEDLAKAQNVDLMSPTMRDSTDQKVKDAKEKLRAAGEGNAFDSAFLQMSVEDHQADIQKAKALQAQATNEQVKQYFNSVIPKLQSHLDQAKTLLNDLGGSQTGR